MTWTMRESVSWVALAACLATGMAAHAAGESASDRLKAQASAQQSNVLGKIPATSSAPSGGSAASGTSASGALLGGALGGSAATGALGASALGGVGGLGLPSLASGSASNVAGVLEYCIKNNYLKKANVSNLKDGLMSKAGLGKTEPEKDNSYASGLSGMLMGGDGKAFNLNSIQGSVKEKACDYVLDNATSLL